jgi:hypothetical protein
MRGPAESRPDPTILAKIAHSFAVAKLGIAGFIPMLPAFILGKNDRNFYYVGGTLDKSGAGTELHELGFEVDESNYLVVRIRLFSSLGAPFFGLWSEPKTLQFNSPFLILVRLGDLALTGLKDDSGVETSM